MKAQTLEISWHAKEPILSVDFCGDRLATAGADNDVKMWRIEGGAGTEAPKVTFLSNLSRHSKAVNVVRFSPNGQYLASASDDSAVIVWKLGPHRTGVFGEEEETEQVETWHVVHMMRTHEEDVYDLAWSPDSRYLASASVDNTVHIWDVSRGKSVQHIKDHKHYVQGVAWDPRGEFLATQSSDRSCRIYSLKSANGKKSANSKEYTANEPKQQVNFKAIYANSKLEISAGVNVTVNAGAGAGAGASEERKSDIGEEGEEGAKTEKAEGVMGPPPTRQYRMYMDETVQSFFRRLAFTPDGSLLLSPAGLAYVGSEGDHEYQLDSITRVGSDSFVNTTFVYARPSLNKPALHFGGLRKPSVVVRCNPVLLELRKNPASAGVEGDSKELESGEVSLVGLPYRMVVAVGTLDAVLLYDTQQAAPFAYLANLHYAPLTDMAWTNDGRTLALSSQDGYVSMVEFAPGELGVPLPTGAYPEHMRLHDDSQIPPIPFASADSTPVKTPAEIHEPRIKKAKLEPVTEPQTPISTTKKDPPAVAATGAANGSPPSTKNPTGDSPPEGTPVPAIPAPSGKAKLNFMKKPANPPATTTTTATTTPPGGDPKGVKRANSEMGDPSRTATATEQKPAPRRIAPTLLTPVALHTENSPKPEGIQGGGPSEPAPKKVCRITPTLVSSDLSNPAPPSTLFSGAKGATTPTPSSKIPTTVAGGQPIVPATPPSTEGAKANGASPAGGAKSETSGDENVQPRRIAPTLISSPVPAANPAPAAACAAEEKPPARRITPTLLMRSANT